MHTPDLTLRPMTPADAPGVVALTDVVTGPGYYDEAMILAGLARATAPPMDDPSGEPIVCAHVALNPADPDPLTALVAYRIAYPPGRWDHGRGAHLAQDCWPAPMERCGYFQTIQVHPQWQGHGLGGRLSRLALDALTQQGAQAVITHSWKESPHNSSVRYLSRLGFEAVAEHPRYWYEVDYTCVRCGSPCVCTAVEMALAL